MDGDRWHGTITAPGAAHHGPPHRPPMPKRVAHRTATATVLALLLALTAVGIGAAPAGALPRAVLPPAVTADHLRDAAGLHVVASRPLDDRMLEVTVTTAALVAPTTFRVLFPTGYDQRQARRYPVLYLLHGASGDETNWTTAGDAEALTEPYPLITVMPSGGRGGWYANWLNFGAGGPPEWETFHIRQLLPFVDANFRTVAGRSGRAIAGLSMGGFGAMSYGARHPDLFTSAASFSGALDVHHPFAQVVIDVSAAADGAKPGQVFGVFADDPTPGLGHDPLTLSPNLRGMRIASYANNGDLGGGQRDTIETWAHETFTTFNANLTRLRLPHLAVDDGPGGHVWSSWRLDLARELPQLMVRFRHPPRRSATFTYTATDPSYSVYGWAGKVKRPVLAFSTLKAGAHGFRLAGTGTASVTTARRYRAGHLYWAVIDPAHGRTTLRLVRADRLGRLSITVALAGRGGDPGSPASTHVTILRAHLPHRAA